MRPSETQGWQLVADEPAGTGRKPEGRPVVIPVRDFELAGDFTIPAEPRGIVVFAHGSGSSRFSPRNRYVAEVLQRSQVATLLMDLLTRDEEFEERYTAHLRFDIPLLADRLRSAASWLAHQVEAAELPDTVKAVVSRGGRREISACRLSG